MLKKCSKNAPKKDRNLFQRRLATDFELLFDLDGAAFEAEDPDLSVGAAGRQLSFSTAQGQEVGPEQN